MLGGGFRGGWWMTRWTTILIPNFLSLVNIDVSKYFWLVWFFVACSFVTADPFLLLLTVALAIVLLTVASISADGERTLAHRLVRPQGTPTKTNAVR